MALEGQSTNVLLGQISPKIVRVDTVVGSIGEGPPVPLPCTLLALALSQIDPALL